MKLLFDQNLSPQLVRLLTDIYGESTHLHSLGMDTASDTEVWQYAVEYSFTIVSKDADFHQRSLLYGALPKVIWLRSGNCSVEESAALLREQYISIHRFLEGADAAFLALS